MTVSTYDSEVREIGHHTRDCDGKKYIIINQTYWYDADKWTDETAAADYMEKRKNGGMTVHKMKAAFVGSELTALIRKVDKDFDRAEYIARPDGEEFVHIFEPSGRMAIKVCVTADSLSAITRDVLKAIE